jgi:hypothetical protein
VLGLVSMFFLKLTRMDLLRFLWKMGWLVKVLNLLMILAVDQVWLVLFEAEVHIMILGFATDTKSTRLQSRKQNPNEFAEGRRI